MDVDFKVDGLQEIERQLNRLTAETAVKHLNAALMAAAKPTYDRARRNASFSDTFVSAIKRKKHRNLSRKGKLHLSLGFRRAATGTNRVTGVSVQVIFKKAPHFHLIEFGTAQRKTKKGYNRGQVKRGRRMLGSAFDGDAPNEALTIFKKRMQARIKRLVKKGQL